MKIRKITQLSLILIFSLAFVSCEEDLTEIGTEIISNDKFDFKQSIYDISVSNQNIDAVKSDNIGYSSKDFLLGVYNHPNYKRVRASIVSQVSFVTGLRNKQSSSDDIKDYGAKENIDSIYNLDKVLVKIPYKYITDQDGKIKLSGVLGNKKIAVRVLRNETYLNSLNPKNPTKTNSFLSDHNYIIGDNLTENSIFEFIPSAKDTTYIFERTKRFNSIEEKFNDTIRIKNSKNKLTPFLVIPLDLQKMRTLFWDKFYEKEFSDKGLFKDYFKGIKLQVEGEDGSIIPINFGNTTNSPSLEFYYTITSIEANKIKKVTNTRYSFLLSGVTTNVYETTGNISNSTSNSFTVQGTAGTVAKLDILTKQQIEELRSRKILINDATLSLYINNQIDTDSLSVPQKLLVYKQDDKSNSILEGIQLSDSYELIVSQSSTQLLNSPIFGGSLMVENGKPTRYKFNITKYLNALIKGKEKHNPLILKVYNYTTDTSVKNKSLDIFVNSYNVEPRGVTLFNKSVSDESKRPQLKISISEAK